MDICFRTFALLFMLFAATSCAPGPRPQDAWAGVRNSSLELVQVAKRVSVEARNGSKDINNVLSELAWIEAEDKCDPETLKQKPEICLSKILSISMNYSSALENLSKSGVCAVFAQQLKPAIEKLQKDMTACVKLSVHPEVINVKINGQWDRQSLCLYTLERFFSFSILTARVFAVGDPAGHMADLPQKCT